MGKYHVTISIMDQLTYTIETASCDEHAGDLAIQLFEQDYPDLNFAIVECEEEIRKNAPDGAQKYAI